MMAGSNKMNALAADKPVEYTVRATVIAKDLPVACRNQITNLKLQSTSSSYSGPIYGLRGNISCHLSIERVF